MDEHGKTQWYIGAPNGVVLCINQVRNGCISGELFHSYSTEPTPFENMYRMTQCMEALYDALRFPHPGNNERSFTTNERVYIRNPERNKIMSDDKLLSRHGDIGTFIVRVQHRQNSSWQGRITWMEEDKTLHFRSIWEMIKLIESAVDTVSEPEESAGDISWFEEKQ